MKLVSLAAAALDLIKLGRLRSSKADWSGRVDTERRNLVRLGRRGEDDFTGLVLFV